MSALERPSEVLLLASFDAASRAEAAARALLNGGLDEDHVALLARDSWGTATVPRSVVLTLPGLGPLRAGGALAAELEAAPADVSSQERLGAALRRVGLSPAELLPLEHMLRADRILLLGVVPSREAFLWGRLLHSAGAVFLSARPRLVPWPPRPRPAGHRDAGARLRPAAPSPTGRCS